MFVIPQGWVDVDCWPYGVRKLRAAQKEYNRWQWGDHAFCAACGSALATRLIREERLIIAKTVDCPTCGVLAQSTTRRRLPFEDPEEELVRAGSAARHRARKCPHCSIVIRVDHRSCPCCAGDLRLGGWEAIFLTMTMLGSDRASADPDLLRRKVEELERANRAKEGASSVVMERVDVASSVASLAALFRPVPQAGDLWHLGFGDPYYFDEFETRPQGLLDDSQLNAEGRAILEASAGEALVVAARLGRDVGQRVHPFIDDFQRHHPSLADRVQDHARAASGEGILQGQAREMGRAFWQLPRVSEISHMCAYCGARIQQDHSPQPVQQTPGRRWVLGRTLLCGVCQKLAWDGNTMRYSRQDRASALAGVRRYRDLTGVLPPSGWQAEPLLLRFQDITDHEDLLDMVRNMTDIRSMMPTPQALRRDGGSGDGWMAFLGEAGLLEVVVTSRGTASRGVDGHWCRSTLELQVCSALSQHGIPHEMEPVWPSHELNPNRMRADFFIDGYMVEVLGMAGNKNYDLKSERKKTLAQLLDIPAIFLLPGDVTAFTTELARDGVSALEHWRIRHG